MSIYVIITNMQFGTNNEIVLTVGEYLERLNIALAPEQGFVEGEVTEFKTSTKWVSFTLRDNLEPKVPSGGGQGAVLKCVLFAGKFRSLGVALEDGMRVKVYGTPRISKGWGSLGLWVETIEPVGEGSLKKAYDLLNKKLLDEGLYARKRELPEFISKIGVITSRDGVVIHDLLTNLPKLSLNVDLVHSQVEGANAVPSILKALKYFATQIASHKDKDKYDCVVIMRGGGSLESMQAFNNEEVARAIFAMPVPVIAGIGHDVDVPISAMVADLAVSTPTAVAREIGDSWSALTEGLPRLEDNILRGMGDLIERAKNSLSKRFEQMTRFIVTLTRGYEQALSAYKRGVERLGVYIANTKERVIRIEHLLTIADPMRNLRLGYSLSTDSNGRVIRSVKNVKKGDKISTRVADGAISSQVL